MVHDCEQRRCTDDNFTVRTPAPHFVSIEDRYVMELTEFLYEFQKDGLQEAVLSSPIDRESMEKVKIRRILLKQQPIWQTTIYRDKKVFHNNYDEKELNEKLCTWIGAAFKQAQLESVHYRGVILAGKRGTLTMKKKQKTVSDSERSGTAAAAGREETHNRRKNYILKEGAPVDFLVELSVMTKEGRVLKERYDKFRQINRFLEFIRDVLPALPADRPIRIIDFGCGKSYLTFAMYYYLHELRGMELEVTGLDLKKDVIADCSALAERLGYQGLHFELGDIAGYQDAKGADMVVTLHACDTATDYALAQAVAWDASVILSVPCCQHEVNRQIQCAPLTPMLKYGIIKERMSALVTDALRAELLREQGYDTQILEFIDLEHTPKNLLIRAVKRKGMRPAAGGQKSQQLAEFMQVHTTLQQLLENKELSE